ncbi:MAG: hypothetical protein R3B84_12305 [Zavarzinella sp.]
MKKICVFAMVAAICTCSSLIYWNTTANVVAQEKKADAKKVKELMGQKQNAAQKVMESLMKGDLKSTVEHTAKLKEIRKNVGFNVIQNDRYKFWAEEFEVSADKLIKTAKENNFEGAKMAYLELTMTCFNCHGFVRGKDDTTFELQPIAK